MYKNLNNMIINYNKNKKQYLETLKNEKNFINRIKKSIPNILTKSRILTPLIILPTVLTGNFLLSTIIISLLGITDFFDGFLARKWNATSEYGRKLDAISDKMYALGVLIPLISFNPLLMLPTLVLETIISSISIKKEIEHKNPYSTFLGKFKTTILYFTFGCLYLANTINLNIINLLPLIISSNTLQIATAIQYNHINKKNNIPQKEDEKINKVEYIKNDTCETIINKRNEIEQYRHLKEILLNKEFEEKIVKIKKKEM